jgi:hypothetical protein
MGFHWFKYRLNLVEFSANQIISLMKRETSHLIVETVGGRWV